MYIMYSSKQLILSLLDVVFPMSTDSWRYCTLGCIRSYLRVLLRKSGTAHVQDLQNKATLDYKFKCLRKCI